MFNSTENTSINGTNITAFDNNMSTVSPPNTQANVTTVNASTITAGPDQNSTSISQLNATNLTNGTIMSSGLDFQVTTFLNGTNITLLSSLKVDNSTTGINRTMGQLFESNLSSNVSVAGNVFLANSSTENIANGTNTTNLTNLFSIYDPASRTNITI